MTFLYTKVVASPDGIGFNLFNPEMVRVFTEIFQMNVKPRSNSIITHTLLGNTLTFHVKDVGEIKMNVSELHPDITFRAMVHGLVQKVGDAAALSRDTQTGKAATPEEKFNAMKNVVDNIIEGQWNAKRVGGSRTSTDTELLIRAIVEYKGLDAEAVTERVKGLGLKDRKALMAAPGIREIIARLRGEEAQDVDTEELLAGITGE